MPVIDTLLLKALRSGGDDDALALVSGVLQRHLGASTASTAFELGATTPDLYVYFGLAHPYEMTAADARAIEAAVAAQAGAAIGPTTADRLQCVFKVPGASHEAPHPFHYVVETDPADGWQEELFRWYDEEHMPGLAAVPGCVLARRYINHDRGPYSLACYDLVDATVTASPAWLAVRESAWSARVRPQFRNTRRTMFRSIAAVHGVQLERGQSPPVERHQSEHD